MSTHWLACRLAERRDWAEGLATFVLDGEVPDFEAGQFLRVGLDIGEREPLSRPYSVGSAPRNPLEFFIVRVEGGALTPRLFDLKIGDTVLVHPRCGGVFTLALVPTAPVLWMVSTGTGLAPFISMLRSGAPLERFERVVVVQGVRFPEQLCYVEELEAMGASSGGRVQHLAIASRADGARTLRGRVTTLLEDGQLEAAAGVEMSPFTSQVMLCGNPDMIAEMQERLEGRGMLRNRKRTPGHVTLEKYW